MKKKEFRGKRKSGGKGKPYRVNLPGFMTEEDIGLGDVIKRVASSVGIRPCGGCSSRAAVLNRWLVFSGRR